MNPKKTLYEVNSNATVVCKEGYQTNSSIVSCVHNRTTIGWNNPPQCSPVHCIHPENPVNGYYLINTVGMVLKSNTSLPFGSSITGLCDLGYENQKSALRICQSNTYWSGSQPVCEKKLCPFPEHIPNGEYSFENGSMYGNGPSNYDTTINVTCKKGYTLFGDEKLFCNDIKIWEGNSSCQKKTCKAPTVPENTLYLEKEVNDSFLQYDKGQFSYLDKVRVVCRHGYIYNVSIKVKQCLENKTCSGDFGNCIVVTCKGLADLTDGFYNYSIDKFSNGYPYNTIVTATCKEQFQLLNPRSKNRICNANGE
jgi:CUB/sushi domain-containing protein